MISYPLQIIPTILHVSEGGHIPTSPCKRAFQELGQRAQARSKDLNLLRLRRMGSPLLEGKQRKGQQVNAHNQDNHH